MKSCRAFGESWSGSGLRKDIRIHRLAAVRGTHGAFRDVVQGLRRIGDTLAPLELIVTLLDSYLPSSHAAFFGLHTPKGITYHFSCIAIEATSDLILDKTFDLGREVNMYCHVGISNG